MTPRSLTWSCQTMRQTANPRSHAQLLVDVTNDVADRGECCLQGPGADAHKHALQTGDVVERRGPQLESPGSLLSAGNQEHAGDAEGRLDGQVCLTLR